MKFTNSYADTEYEAINQLSKEIVNLYKYLKEDRENLGPLQKIPLLSGREKILVCYIF